MNPTTRYLLGLILVLALCLVALEWNSTPSGWSFFDTEEDPLEAEMELSPLHRDKDEVPMMMPQEQQEQAPPSEELNLVEEEAKPMQEVDLLPFTAPEVEPPSEEKEEELPKAVDMYDAPVDFRVVEDLPQFPGGAVEFIKWLTKNLRYPISAQQRKIQGRVVAQFIVNKDGSISDLQLVEKLDAQCDREALRVLRMMPKWQAGVMNAKPCRTKVCIPIVFKL